LMDVYKKEGTGSILQGLGEITQMNYNNINWD